MALDLVTILANDILARADQLTLIRNQIYVAASLLHAKSYFQRDLVETFVEVEATTPVDRHYPMQITIPANFRKWHYIRPQRLDNSLAPLLARREPTDIFDHYDRTRLITQSAGMYYTAGLNCNIFMGEPVKGFLLGYFANPISSLTFDQTDWLCQNYSDAVLNLAASRFYVIVENESLAARYYGLHQDNADSLLRLEPQYDTED